MPGASLLSQGDGPVPPGPWPWPPDEVQGLRLLRLLRPGLGPGLGPGARVRESLWLSARSVSCSASGSMRARSSSSSSREWLRTESRLPADALSSEDVSSGDLLRRLSPSRPTRGPSPLAWGGGPSPSDWRGRRLGGSGGGSPHGEGDELSDRHQGRPAGKGGLGGGTSAPSTVSSNTESELCEWW